MFEQHQTNTTFEQSITVAPTIQPVNTSTDESVKNDVQQSTPANSMAMPLQPTSATFNTPQKARVGEAHQPNRFYELILVSLQFIALVIIVVAFVPSLLWQNTMLQIIGSTLVAMGIALGTWAAISFRQKIRIMPSPANTGFLVTGGPFAYIRHPMYSALLLASIGLFLAYPTIARLAAMVVLGLVLMAKMNYEERMLQERYTGYDAYRAHTGRIFPRFSRHKKQPNINSPRPGSQQ